MANAKSQSVPSPVAAPGPGAAALSLPPGEQVSGARSVEVAAMLGDSVVGVKHVMNPRGGRVSTLTYAMFAVGAALLLSAAIAFATAVSNAKMNKEALRVHTEELKLPYHEFRAKSMSPTYDWLAFGGLAGALVCFAWGLVRIRNERVSPCYRIGSAPDVDFPIDNPTFSGSFPLIAPHGDDFVLNFTHAMLGELTMEGATTPLGELSAKGMAYASPNLPGAMEMRIPNRARVRVTSGQNTFIVSSGAAPRRHAAPLFATLSTTVLAFFAGSAILHLGVWALLRTVPPDPKTLSLRLGGDDGRTTRAFSKATEDPVEDVDEKLDEASKADQPGGTGTQMALESGKMGNEKSDRVAGRYTMEDKGVPPQLARQHAMDKARRSGILSALQGDMFSSLTGTADFSSGLHDADVYGGMLGDEVGEMHGGFGFGDSGFGPGAGGTSWGTIGTGRYGTIGWGDGTGDGYRSGPGGGKPFARTSKIPKVDIGVPDASSGLDKKIIRRYIRRKLPRIKHCYERELMVKSGLKGTVVSNFQISPTGAVLGSSAKGVNDDVSSCVSDVIKTIQFPKPRVGALVQVRYPFNFRPTGG